MRRFLWAVLTAVFLGAPAAPAEEPAAAPATPPAAPTTKAPDAAAQETAPEQTQESAPQPAEELEKRLYSGRVIFARDALKKRGVTAFDELDDQVVLEATDGTLYPIVPDWRGRAFFQDERLRDRPVDLVGVQRPGVPYLQVLIIYTFDEQGVRQYTDYWCDICSIPMYEIKPCDCCQADTRLRFQPQELPDYLREPTDAESERR